MAEFEAVMADGFPAGLRVFAVDENSVVLRTLELMLLECGYKVTVSNHALQALELLRANKSDYDIVITDINMSEMDGFKFLEIMGVEINLPIIILSTNSDRKSVMKCIEYGAVDYLLKPVRLEELRLIWKNVAKRFLNEKKYVNINESNTKDVQNSQMTKKSKDRVRKRDEDVNIDSEEDVASKKRARINWTPELHAKFINAINQLGVDRAVPNKILDIMEIPELTRENVASHLQKYRKSLKRSTIEFGQKVFDNAGIREYNRNSLPMTIDKSRTNLYKDKPISSSYVLGQQSRNCQDLVSQTWFPPPIRHHNNFHPQYMMNSIGSTLGGQHLGMTMNSHSMNMSTQLPNYQSTNTSLSWLNCKTQSSSYPLISDGYIKHNSVAKVGSIMDQQITDIFLNSNVNGNNNSNELAASFTFEQERQQTSSGSGTDVQINLDLLDVFSHNFEDHGGSNTSNFTIFSEEHLSTETIENIFDFDNLDYMDDVHLA